MWVKLSPGVNFTTILHATFTREDPKSAKNTDDLAVFFVHLGSALVRALNNMLVKLNPYFININIDTIFCHADLCRKPTLYLMSTQINFRIIVESHHHYI